MAITPADLEDFARVLKGAMKTSNLGDTIQTPSQRAEKSKEQKILKDNSSALNFLKEALKKNSDILSNMSNITKASNKVFQDAVDSASSLKELNKLPEHFKRAMDRSSSTLLKGMTGSVETLEDMFTGQAKIEKLPEVKALMQSFVDGEMSMMKLEAHIETLGYSAEDAAKIVGKFGPTVAGADGYISKYSKATNIAQKTVDNFDNEIREANDSVRKFGDSVSASDSRLKSLGKSAASLAVLLGKELFSAAEASMKFGAELSLVQSRLAGMAPEEFAQMQAENRQAINALTGGFNEFDTILSSSNKQLLLYTGSLKDSSKLVANMITTSRMLGDSTVDTNKFVQSQSAAFKSFNRQLSMTADEFASMNDRLIQDSDVRATLYKMGEKERVQHFQGLQMQVKTYRSWGLLQGQAEELAKSMERAAGMGAKERLKMAARQRAVMGAFGMGGVGAEAQKIRIKGARATPEEQARLAEINKQFADVVSKKMGDSFQSELLTQTMLQKAQLDDTFGPKGTMANTVLAAGAQQTGKMEDAVGKWTSKVGGDKIVQAITDLKQTLVSFLGSSFIAALVGALAISNFGKGLMNLVGKGGGSLLSGLKGLVSGEGASMLGTAARGAARFAGPAAAVGVVGKDVYDLATGDTSNENKYGVGFGVAGGIIGAFGGPVGIAIGASLGNVVGNEIGKYLDSLDKPTNDVAAKQMAQAEQLEATMADLKDAIEHNNKAAMETAINTAKTQMAILDQTASQKDEAQKTRDETKTNQRQVLIRRRGTGMR